MTRSTGGMVRQHPARGLWEARYTGADGKRHSLYAKTRREVQERLRAALTDADHGIRPIGNRTTVAAYLDDWLASSVRLRVRPRTADSYAETVERYIKPAIGRQPLAKLTPEHVARMLADLTVRETKRGRLSPTTIRYAYTVLRIALGRALKSGKVLRNVATLVDPPAKSTPEMHPPTVEQVSQLLAATWDDRMGPLYVLAATSGLRQGETLALRWSDVDLEAATVTVRHTLERGTRALAEPKTDRARRTVHISGSTVAVLREHRRGQLVERLAAGPRWRDAELVFTTRDGGPLHARNVLAAYHAALEGAGLPRFRWHDLRHWWATAQLEAGEDLFIVSRALGHADITTTANIYAHLTPAMLRRSADRMDAILGRRETSRGSL